MGSKPRVRAEGRGSAGIEPPMGPRASRDQSGWPGWARVVATVALLYHMAAVLAGALGVPPSSELEQAIADGFTPYFDLMDLGYSYRFYTEPSPTPVVTAALQFGEGRPEEIVRLPARHVPGPWMRHQRQLALANALNSDVQEARRRAGDASQSRLARAYARHLCRSRPGCRTVTLRVQQHLIPDPAQAREAIAGDGLGAGVGPGTGSPRLDLFDDRMFSTPEWIGDYPCDAF